MHIRIMVHGASVTEKNENELSESMLRWQVLIQTGRDLLEVAEALEVLLARGMQEEVLAF